jgi:hypothetical protein
MKSRKALPDINKLSIVAAAIMLVFALTELVSFPAQQISFNIFAILIRFEVDFSTVITLLTAILAAAGMDWLIHLHPMHHNYQKRWEYMRHWIVPVLTTSVLGVALNTFVGGPFWWVIFGFGSILLITVFIAEYKVLDIEDVYHPIATVGLTALSFALFLLLAIAVSSAGLRLYVRLPLLGIGLFLVIARSLFLRLGKWLIVWAIVLSLGVMELSIGLHYLPVNPIQYGTILVGLAYALTGMITAINENRKGFSFWGEPVVMVVVMVLVSFIWS